MSKPVKSSSQNNEWKSSTSINKYTRGSVNFSTKNIKHKGLRKTLEETKDKHIDAATRTAATEILLPSTAGFIEVDGNEKVFKLKQKEILQNVDLNTAKNSIDLQLTKFGPYNVDYSRNGRCAQLYRSNAFQKLSNYISSQLQVPIVRW
jgi:U3 small nucleolar RNA-associated protein 7